jgi:spore maturation protein CgeB
MYELYENRRQLLRILKRCKELGVATVFWAKEDPAYFQDAVQDFTDTAMYFDHILTTAEECVPKYEQMGHKSVHLWPFGFSPEIFYPPGNKLSKADSLSARNIFCKEEAATREQTAVFAGSWYRDQHRRCLDMEMLFDMVLSSGIELRIYDRNRVSGNSSAPFPEQYRPFVRDAVGYEALGDIFRNARYAININTTCDSASMFARRVYEAMACGCIIISNDSAGMRKQFGNRVWFVGENFSHSNEADIRLENINEVFLKHTWAARMRQLWEIVERSHKY